MRGDVHYYHKCIIMRVEYINGIIIEEDDWHRVMDLVIMSLVVEVDFVVVK